MVKNNNDNSGEFCAESLEEATLLNVFAINLPYTWLPLLISQLFHPGIFGDHMHSFLQLGCFG